jgi:predicted metal-binding protein
MSRLNINKCHSCQTAGNNLLNKELHGKHLIEDVEKNFQERAMQITISTGQH